jgi:hypothetical protein
MKKLILLALTLVAFNANAGFNVAQPVHIKTMTCQKDGKRTNYYEGVGGAAYTVDWADDFCANVSADFRAATQVQRYADGSVKGTKGSGVIHVLKPIKFKILGNTGWKSVTVPTGNYRSFIDGASRNRTGDNYIDVKSTKFSMRLFFRGKDEANVKFGYLRVSFLVDGFLKNYYLDCNTAAPAFEFGRKAFKH